MSKKRKRARAEPKKRSSMFLCSMDAYNVLCSSGYIRISDNPEILACVNKIADLVSNATIHLMENTENGDVRIKNGISRKIDISPNKYMTRKTFISALVRQLLLEGDGNAIVFPETKNGYLENLLLFPPNHCSLLPKGYGYEVLVDGKYYDPNDICHVLINPDPLYPWKGTGYRVALKDVSKTLKQAYETKDGFMKSKWNPSIIVKVDGLIDEFASKEGRKKLLEQYIETSEAGEPWMVPAEQFDIKEVRPLSLNDIALPDSVKLDKRTVAAILDVPPYLVGEGSFEEDEWNNFINTRIRGICSAIEQAFTKCLLINPNWYFRFNPRSLYSYDIEKLSRVGDDNYTRGIMTGNEVRDWIGLSPKEGLDELVILENYIPVGMISEQKKLIQGGGNGE